MEIDKIIIEKSIPIPAPRMVVSKWKELLSRMECGDSVLIKDECTVNSLRLAFGKQGAKVTVRKGENGTRIWLIEKGGSVRKKPKL